MIQRVGPLPFLHRVVEHNGVIYVAGMVADDFSLDMRGQTEQVLRKIERLLQAQGSSKAKILSCTIFITDLLQKGELNAAWQAWLTQEEMPARATIGISDLGPGVLVEITTIAAK